MNELIFVRKSGLIPYGFAKIYISHGNRLDTSLLAMFDSSLDADLLDRVNGEFQRHFNLPMIFVENEGELTQ